MYKIIDKIPENENISEILYWKIKSFNLNKDATKEDYIKLLWKDILYEENINQYIDNIMKITSMEEFSRKFIALESTVGIPITYFPLIFSKYIEEKKEIFLLSLEDNHYYKVILLRN